MTEIEHTNPIENVEESNELKELENLTPEDLQIDLESLGIEITPKKSEITDAVINELNELLQSSQIDNETIENEENKSETKTETENEEKEKEKENQDEKDEKKEIVKPKCQPIVRVQSKRFSFSSRNLSPGNRQSIQISSPTQPPQQQTEQEKKITKEYKNMTKALKELTNKMKTWMDSSEDENEVEENIEENKEKEENKQDEKDEKEIEQKEMKIIIKEAKEEQKEEQQKQPTETEEEIKQKQAMERRQKQAEEELRKEVEEAVKKAQELLLIEQQQTMKQQNDEKLSQFQTKPMKIIMIGESSVGKTSVMNKFVDNEFSDVVKATIGIGVSRKNLQVKNKTIQMQIWDTAGQERFATISSNYFRNAIGVIIMFDVTNRQSFDNLPKWFEQCEKASDKRIMFICGNKIDLKNRMITKEDGEEMAESFGTKYFEVSAKTGEGINEMFEALALSVANASNDYIHEAKDNVDLNNQNEIEEKKGCC